MLDDGVVPELGLRVLVDGGAGDCGVAGVVADLAEARGGDGRVGCHFFNGQVFGVCLVEVDVVVM